MAKELMEIGGFITSGAEIVNHDNSLSGNGTSASPLGVVPGYNETLLYSGTSVISTGTLNEDWRNFEYLRVCFAEQASTSAAYMGGQLVADLDVQQCLNGYNNRSACMAMSFHDLTTNNPIGLRVGICYMTGPTTFSSYHVEKSTNSTTVAGNIGNMWVSKVIGINRKA